METETCSAAEEEAWKLCIACNDVYSNMMYFCNSSDSSVHYVVCIFKNKRRYLVILFECIFGCSYFAVFSKQKTKLTLWRPLLPYGYSYKARPG